MTLATLVRRNWRYHLRAHVGAMLGAAVAGAVLVGALVVGDSVRESLARQARLRLGRVETALASGDRLFRADMWASAPGQPVYFQAGPSQPLRSVLSAPVLHLPAVAVAGGGDRRANEVQVYGVDARFGSLASGSGERVLAPGEVALNEPLARQLRVQPGDEVLFRVQKPSALSRDSPLAPEEELAEALRLRVVRVAGDLELGRFSLAANQEVPFNAFVSLNALQERMDVRGRANLLLAGQAPSSPPVQNVSGAVWVNSPAMATSLTDLATRTLRLRWQLADAELELRKVPASGLVELRSRRVFLDPPIGHAVFGDRKLTNSLASRIARQFPGLEPYGVLTYFVNEVRAGERRTPYSMVTAAGPPLTPADLKEDEILISDWLAKDLGVSAEQSVVLRYYVIGLSRALEEREARFRVRAVYPLEAAGIDRQLMPDFPGMSDAESCRDWDTGLPIDTGRIRSQDEDFWRRHRGTPKALVSLAAGQKLWANRFGELSAIRFPITPPGASQAVAGPEGRNVAVALNSAGAALGMLLQQGLNPGELGLRFRAVREEAEAASTQGQDFGALFLGFSLFLVGSALLLAMLLSQFGVESRATEVGTLLAVGFRFSQVWGLLTAEGVGVALVGSLLGTWGGIVYARAMIHGLATVWKEAVGGAGLQLEVVPTTIVTGVVACTGVTALAIAVGVRRLAAQPARLLLARGGELESLTEPGGDRRGRRWWRAVSPANGRGGWAWAGLLVIAAAALVVWGILQGGGNAGGIFFGAGTLLLAAGLMAAGVMMRRWPGGQRLTVRHLAWRGVTRRARRSLTVIGLLASGCFIVAAVSVFRLEAQRDGGRRNSGTGGFALLGRSTQPVLHDLDTARGREVYGLETNRLAGVFVVPFRVLDGDEASCLNLNRAQRPRLLGVDPERLASRGAFRFVRVAKGYSAEKPWMLLNQSVKPQPGLAAAAEDWSVPEIPAIGDQASILWALGRKVGEAVEYTDERGNRVRLRLVAAVGQSILQGSLVISEEAFTRLFPGSAGYRMFLIDAPPNGVGSAATELTRGLQDLGLEVQPAAERLVILNAVQNTYLGTFQVLGGLGVVLGSFGLGVVVLRNVLERRGELAVLVAVGWRRETVRRMILWEHAVLLGAGLVLGLFAAGVAVLPGLVGQGTPVPFASVGLTLGGVLVSGWAWIWLASQTTLRGCFLDALRNS